MDAEVGTARAPAGSLTRLAGAAIPAAGAAVAVGLSSDPALLGALLAIAAVAYTLHVWLADDVDGAGGATFDATVDVAIVALALLGPAAALAVFLVPDAIHRLVLRRCPVFTRGLAFNLASFSAAIAAGAAALELGGLAGVAVAAVAMSAINFPLAPLAYARLFEGPDERRELLEQARSLALTCALMGAIAVGVVAGYEAAGLAVLAGLAVAVALPELRWDAAVDHRLVARILDPAAAARSSSRDDDYQHAAHILDTLQVQLAAIVTAAAPADRAERREPDLDEDLVTALVALRRVTSRAELDLPYQDASEAMVRLLERQVGSRHLRAVPEDDRQRL